MSKRYYIDVSREEIATVSYFPAWEIRNNSRSEWINKVLVPALLPVVRRKNKKFVISQLHSGWESETQPDSLVERFSYSRLQLIREV